MRADWKKAGRHRHLWSHYELIRRNVFGGHTWQVFCLGNHENHKRCSSWALASASKIEDAKAQFDRYLESHEQKSRVEETAEAVQGG